MMVQRAVLVGGAVVLTWALYERLRVALANKVQSAVADGIPAIARQGSPEALTLVIFAPLGGRLARRAVLERLPTLYGEKAAQ